MPNSPRRSCIVLNCWEKLSLLVVAFILGSCQSFPSSPSTPPTNLPPTTDKGRSLSTNPNSTPLIESPAASQTPLPALTTTPATPVHRYPTATSLSFYSEPMSIGRSAGGKPILVHRFGTGPKHRLIIAGIHGGFEWNTIKLANQLIDYVIQNPGLIPTDTTLYVMPSLNPDGEARGHGPTARANENGVDLNRNFPTNWKSDWPRTGCWQMGQISAGRSPLSEPESAALAQFLTAQSIDALISYHSAGLGIYPGENPAKPFSEELANKLASESIYSYPPFETGCLHTGTLVDFAAGIGIAAVDIELTTRWDPEFEVNINILRAFLLWNESSEQNILLPEN